LGFAMLSEMLLKGLLEKIQIRKTFIIFIINKQSTSIKKEITFRIKEGEDKQGYQAAPPIKYNCRLTSC